MVHSQDQGLDESVNRAQRRFVDTIPATDNVWGLIAGVRLIEDDQDDYFEVKVLHY